MKSLQGEPTWEPVYCHSLVDFVGEALRNADRDFFLRMTSFSLSVKELEGRRRLRRRLLERVRWLPPRILSAKTPEEFRDAYGCAINAAVPQVDLLVIDEGHNLKHGFGPSVSNRNRVMGFAFGHPEGKADEYPWYRPKAQRVLLLSATPFEDDYAAIQRQLEVFGFGRAKLWDSNGAEPVRADRLLGPDVSEDEKRDIVARLGRRNPRLRWCGGWQVSRSEADSTRRTCIGGSGVREATGFTTSRCVSKTRSNDSSSD